jgi:hypothetical protein
MRLTGHKLTAFAVGRDFATTFLSFDKINGTKPNKWHKTIGTNAKH